MSETNEIVLPEQVTQSTAQSPKDLVVIAQPKMGKSAIFGDFSVKYNALVFNLEKGGYDYIDAKKVDVYQDDYEDDYDAYSNYIAIRNLLLQNKGKYDVLIIDGLSDLDRLSEIGGTKMYMASVMGKAFNREGGRKGGKELPHTHKDYKSVLTLADGAGYRWTRDWFLEQIEIFRRISPYRLYAAHVADKYIQDKTRDEVIGQELFLTGKLKNIFATKVTALGKLVAEDEKRYLNFDVLNDSIIAGSRAPSLKGRILISQKEKNNSITTYWENIYSEDLLTKIKNV